MVDHNQPTGTGGTLTIRDNGSSVEFLISNSNTATYVGSLNWSGTVNGSPVSGSLNWPTGGGTRSVGSWAVSSSQTVSFGIAATGTTGFGGPTSFSAFIPRATVPATPATPWATDIQPTQMTLNWTIPADGGSPISNMLLRLNTSLPVDGPGYTDFQNSGSVTSRVVTELIPGTTYYWVVYARNAVGYSLKSPALTTRTLGGFRISDGTTWQTWVVDVSDGSAWHRQRVDVSDGSAWRPAG